MPTTFSGVWQPGSKEQFVLCNWKQETFTTKIRELVGDGFHLTSLCSTIDVSERKWHGVVTKTERDDPEGILELDVSQDKFKDHVTEMRHRGFGFGCIDTQLIKGKPEYSVFWTRDPQNTKFTRGVSWSKFRIDIQTARDKQLVPIDISTIFDGTQRLWTAVFGPTDEPEDFAFFVDTNLQSLITQSQFLANRSGESPSAPDLHLARLIAYHSGNNGTRYAGLFRQGPNASTILSNVASSELIAAKKEKQAQSHLIDIEGLRPIPKSDSDSSSSSNAAELRVHVQYLFTPSASERNHIDRQIENTKLVYRKHGFAVNVFSPAVNSRPGLKSIRLADGKCRSLTFSVDQKAVFRLRDPGLKSNDIVLFIVRNVIGLAGCAAHPNKSEPGAIVETQSSSVWTMAHELGHVMGLLHKDGSRRRGKSELMYTPTARITSGGRLPILTKRDIEAIRQRLKTFN